MWSTHRKVSTAPVTSLSAQGGTAGPGELFATLRAAVADGLEMLARDPQAVLESWSRHAIGLLVMRSPSILAANA